MTKDNMKHFSEVLNLAPERVERILQHLLKNNQAWCFVDGQIIDRWFCEEYLRVNKEGA